MPLQSCGICKEMLKHYSKLCREVSARKLLQTTCATLPIAYCMQRTLGQTAGIQDALHGIHLPFENTRAALKCLLGWLRELLAWLLQSGGQMAGARFLKHNIRDDFDDLTDVARLYGIRAVPCFVFFIGGAQV